MGENIVLNTNSNSSALNDGQYYFEKGRVFFENDENQDAYECFSKAVEIEPTNPEFLAQLAFASCVLNKDEECYELSNKAVEINPKCINAYRARSKGFYWFKNDVNSALQDLNKAISIDNTNNQLYSDRGSLYSNNKQFDLAYKDFLLALKLEPNDDKSYSHMAFMYYQTKQFLVGIDCANKAIEINPKNISAIQFRAYCNFELKKYPEAIADLTICIDKAHNLPEDYQSRAACYHALNNREAALIDRAMYYEKGSKKELLDRVKNGRREEGDEWLEKIDDYFEKAIRPKINIRGDKFIEYFPCQMLWNSRESMHVQSGNSTSFVYGNYGTGIICFSTRNVYLYSDSELSLKFPLFTKNAGRGLLRIGLGLATGSYIPDSDKRQLEKNNQEWEILNSTITGAQMVDSHVYLVTPALQWEIYSLPELNADILAALNLAIQNRYEQIWAPPQPQLPPELPRVGETKDALSLIRELAQMKADGIINENEFETKKKELLSRL